MAVANLAKIVDRYKQDSESVYNTWFINNDTRMAAFPSIERGVIDVIASIENSTFGHDFKGSPLEYVLNCIVEQKQIFKGAAHAFYWKPKLGIPDIYENEENQRAFGRFLKACLTANSADRIVEEINQLNLYGIKGLGPAVANILYFLHPKIMSPSNTAIVNGYNAIFTDKKKLGCWQHYFEMRELIVKTNEELKPELSKDLGALSGLLFDVGVGKIAL